MSSPTYTCITCRVAFTSPDLQRAHYKSDWHRYNLKRKVAEMPAVTAEDFKQRVLAQQAQSAEAQKDTATMCKICSKHFSTENAYSNHLQSKKHRETEAKLAKKQESEMEKRNAKNKEKGLDGNDKADAEMDNKAVEEAGASSSGASSSSSKRNKNNDTMVVDDDEEDWEDVEGDAIATTDCLFCNKSSVDTEKNVEHMTKAHSFFIPNIEYMSDLEGFLTYIGEKVGSGFMCIWCNEKGRAFYSLEAVQTHMRDKGHCKLEYEGDAAYEYAEYFDFRSSYPDHEGKQEGGEGDGDVAMEEDEEVEEERLNTQQDGYELVLPSGARIGHRELQRYYKQNLPMERQLVKRNPGMIGRLMSQYKALGWTGTTGDAAQKKVKDLRYIQKFRSKQQLKTQLKANKLQPHLRPQVVF